MLNRIAPITRFNERISMKAIVLSIFTATVFFGCNLKGGHHLTLDERHFCDSLQIDTSLVMDLRQMTAATVEPFHYSLEKSINDSGVLEEVNPIRLQGLVFKEDAANTDRILLKLHDPFKAKGYMIFAMEKNFGFKKRPDIIGILTTADKYEVLKEIKTEGKKYRITPDSLCALVRSFDAKYSLELIGAGGDWCEFIIGKEPSAWMEMAQEAYAVCPDIVKQGTKTVKALAQEMQKTKRVYFWWD
jgi:hypothetical protein